MADDIHPSAPPPAAEAEVERLRAECDRLRKDRDFYAKELDDRVRREDTLGSTQLTLLAAQLSKEIRGDFLESVKRWLWVLALLVSVASAGGLFTLSDILKNRIDSAVEGKHKDIERLREGILNAIVEAKIQVADVKNQAGSASKDLADLKVELSEHKRRVASESAGAILEIRRGVLAVTALTPEQEGALRKAKEREPGKFRSDPERKWKFWANGSTIRIRFIDGDSPAREEIKLIAQQWTKHANLKLDFGEHADAAVRISLKKGQGAWSYLGTDALGIKNEPTMTLGWIDTRTVLHEFGHVLGLIHEFSNPTAKIPWNKPLIYKEAAGPPNFWDMSTVNALLATIPATELGQYRDFDSRSVMNFAFPKTWTGGVTVEQGNELSESDKALAARLYPRTN